MKSKILFPLLFLNLFMGLINAQTSNLSIDLMVDNERPNIRSTIKFTITVNNAGPDEATGVSVLNEFASGYGNITEISGEGILAGNTIDWSHLTVPVNQNIYLHFKARVLSSGNYENKAEIIACDNLDPNSDTDYSHEVDDLADKIQDDDEVELTSIQPIPSNMDNDTVFDIFDLDDDNDGAPDTYESNGINPDDDFDNDGTPVYLDDNDNNFDIGDNNNAVEPFFDFDRDSIANHLDLDADGDGILDVYETGHKKLLADFKGRVRGSFKDFGANGLLDKIETANDTGMLTYALLNTDNDDDLNILDVDDDNDGILTINENADPNGDGNPSDARDTDKDGIPDYLDNDDTDGPQEPGRLEIDEEKDQELRTVTIATKNSVIDVKLFTDKGVEITPEIRRIGNLVQLDISSLESGIYFVQFKTGRKVDIKRMVID